MWPQSSWLINFSVVSHAYAPYVGNLPLHWIYFLEYNTQLNFGIIEHWFLEHHGHVEVIQNPNHLFLKYFTLNISNPWISWCFIIVVFWSYLVWYNEVWLYLIIYEDICCKHALLTIDLVLQVADPEANLCFTEVCILQLDEEDLPHRLWVWENSDGDAGTETVWSWWNLPASKIAQNKVGSLNLGYNCISIAVLEYV